MDALVSPRRRRVGQWVKRVAAIVGATLVIALATLLVALDWHPTREFIRKQVNHSLSDQFTGQLVIDRIGSLRLDGLAGIDAHLLDPQGRRVATLQGLRLKSNWPTIVRDLVLKRPLNIVLAPVSVDHVDAYLVDGGDGGPSLASAFNPRHPTPAVAPSKSATAVHVERLQLRHLWVHGSLPQLALIDAELSGLAGAFSSSGSGIIASITSGRLVARALPSRAEPTLALTARIEIPANDSAAMSGFAEAKGQVAQAPLSVHADWHGKHVTAKLQAPAIPSSVLTERLPGVAIRGATALEAQLSGQLPHLAYDANVKSEAATLKISGSAALESTTRLSCDLSATNVNLAAALPDTATTNLSAELHATLSLESGGAMEGDFRVLVPPGSFADNRTPLLSSAGKLSRRAAGLLRIEGTLSVTEPGAPVRAAYHLDVPAKGDPVLRAEASTTLDEPKRLEKVAGVKASGMLVGSAEFNLRSSRLAARLSAHLAPVSAGETRAQTLELHVTANGNLASPELTLVADAANVVATGRTIRSIHVATKGTPHQLQVEVRAIASQQPQPPQRLELQTQLSLTNEAAMNGVNLTLTDRDGSVSLRARRVELQKQRIQFEGLELSGAGELSASGSFDGHRVAARVSSHELDFGRLLRLAGMKRIVEGRLTLEGQVVGTVNDLQGRLQGRATELAIDNVRGGRLELDVALHDRRLDGVIQLRLGSSQLDLKIADLDLPTLPFSGHDIQEMRGDLTAEGYVNLEQFAPAVRAAGAPIERLSGLLSLDLHARNPRIGPADPKLNVRLSTRELRLVEQRAAGERIDTPSQALQVEPRAIEGVDAIMALDIDSAVENARFNITLQDRNGPLVTLEGESKTPSLGSSNLMAQLEALPMRIALRIPERALQKLPSVIRPSVMRGILAASVDADGTLHEPRVRAQLSVLRLQAREGRYSMDVHADAKYDSNGGTVDARARSTRGGTGEVHSLWKGNLLQRLLNADTNSSRFFELKTDINLQQFPLAVIPALSDREVRGPLTGSVMLRGLGHDAQLEANFDGSGMTVNRVRLPGLKLSLKANDTALLATLDGTQDPGRIHGEFGAPCRWGSRWLPEIDPRAKLRVTAKAFQLEALSPLVLRYLSTLEGSLDADITAQLDPQNPVFQGTAELKSGVVQIPQIGQRLSDVAAKVTIRNGEVVVDSVQARGITGRLTGHARAKLRGIDLESVTATVDISQKEKLPVTLEGVMLGDAWGHADLGYRKTDGETTFKIDVPEFRLEMPEASQNSVQTLDPAEDVRIGAHRTDGTFVPVPLQPLRSGPTEDAPQQVTRVDIHLGNSVWVSRGRQATVQLAGDLGMESGAEQKLSGRIEIKGGRLDVSGKRFEVERGVVTFEGSDVSDPTITATARWDSPAGYVVYADYAGTAKDGKLKLRAEPGLTQDEILSLLMFGTPEGTIASSGSAGTGGSLGSSGSTTSGTGSDTNANSSSSGTAGAAVSIAGGTATKGLNRAISDVTNLDVSTRIDTSTGSARPELVLQLTPRLTTRVTRALGEPPPGQSPDMTFLTLELRLKRTWSVSAVVGDRGATTLDLIWRKRY